jgi:hypothetical protein
MSTNLELTEDEKKAFIKHWCDETSADAITD